MLRHYLTAGLVCLAFAQPALATRAKKAVDNADAVKALVRPGTASRKLEAANRAAAIAFWQAICTGPAGEDETKFLSAGFVNHAPGLAAGGQAFIDALRAREQGWKLSPGKAPLFALSTGELVMIGQGADAQNPQATFHVSVFRLSDGKISEYWADGG
jgi:predicted SnoaL-like aldol condensation-catalyzing enzyme